MGMYTSMVVSCQLKEGTPSRVIELLDRGRAGFIGGRDSKELFGEDWVGNPFWGSSAGLPGSNFSLKPCDHGSGCELHITGSIKNTMGEIEHFLEWLRPHVDSGHGAQDWWALVTYEESDEPTIYYLEDA